MDDQPDQAKEEEMQMRQIEREKIEKLKQKLLVKLDRDQERRKRIEAAAAGDKSRMQKENAEYLSLIKDAYVLKEYINYARHEMEHYEVVKLENDMKELVKKVKSKQAQLFNTN